MLLCHLGYLLLHFSFINFLWLLDKYFFFFNFIRMSCLNLNLLMRTFFWNLVFCSLFNLHLHLFLWLRLDISFLSMLSNDNILSRRLIMDRESFILLLLNRLCNWLWNYLRSRRTSKFLPNLRNLLLSFDMSLLFFSSLFFNFFFFLFLFNLHNLGFFYFFN